MKHPRRRAQLAGFPGLHKAESESGSYIVVGFGPESAAQLLSLAVYMQARPSESRELPARRGGLATVNGLLL